jgi:two-component system chemotaxis sensor kinase CheA
MSEFIEQFILESRELIEQASAALLALERSPRDAECVDAAFRAIHTLKGGAAIVDFFAMERAVHAAEDALSAVRAGERAPTAALIGDCFACLDQVGRWLDSIEQSGELPAGAEAQASHFIARMKAAAEPRSGVGTGITKSWFEDLKTSDEGVRTQAKTVVRFSPQAASFYQGEDPLALIASMPGLVSMDLATAGEPGLLDELDPFECILVATAFSAASTEVVSSHFEAHGAECEILSLETTANTPADALDEPARQALKAQLTLLEATQVATFIGRVASAGRVAANVLRHCRQGAAADLIERATKQSLDAQSARYLGEAIANLLASAAPGAQATNAGAHEQAPAETATRSFRVDAERVDALVRLTGELTVVKNAIGHVLDLAHRNDSDMAGALTGPHKNLEHLIGELQSAVLSIRVLPLRTVLQRFPRLVREISAALEKPVTLRIEGDETEADKAIVEMLFEPLLHLVRNAMDHGIEAPNVRREQNKPAIAALRIRAFRQGGQVLIEVEDDGGGVDITRVRAVAKDQGIATTEVLDAMPDEQVVDLIFAPGFSTSSQVTGLSGRGVGMDAVRSAVERVGGRVTIESRAGLGTTVRLMLPFSVMLTKVMMVEAGGQMFGIPFDAIVETVSVATDEIEGVGAAQAIVRRNRTLPLFELAGLLGVRRERNDARDAIVVVAAVAGQWGGLLVDRLGERMEVMLKPLDGLLAGLPGIAGTTILGDGRVLLVLDLAELLQ